MQQLNDILNIPDRCMLNRKLPKTFFKRNFELTSYEKALLDDPNIITAMEWVATISPLTANVPAYNNQDELYEEIQLITIQVNPLAFEQNKLKLAELVQKYIPYQLLVAVYAGDEYILNTWHKRINQNDGTKRILDKACTTQTINTNKPTEHETAFAGSITYARLDKTSLKTLYDNYSQCIIALQAAELIGKFTPRTASRSQQDMHHLERIDALEKDILLLQAQAKKETQMNERVRLNMEIQGKRKEIETIKTLITA